MPPKPQPHSKSKKVLELQIGVIVAQLQEMGLTEKKKKSLKDQKRRLETEKHRDEPPKQLVPLSRTSIFVKHGQKDPPSYLRLLQICHQNPIFSEECKVCAQNLREKGPRDDKKKAICVWLGEVCGCEIDSENAEFILIVSEIVQRLFDTKGKADCRHFLALQERIAFFIKGQLAEACVEAVRTLCPQHFEMFVGMVNSHPKAQHAAVKVKSEVAGEERMESSPVVCVKARAHGGGGADAVAFISNGEQMNDDLSDACGGAAAAPVRRGKGGGARGGGARATDVMAEALVRSGKKVTVKPLHVVMLPPGAPEPPKNGRKFANRAVICLLGDWGNIKGRMCVYFRTNVEMDDAMHSFPEGTVVLNHQDLIDAQLLQKKSYDDMQAKNIARAAGIEVPCAPVSSRRGPVAEQTHAVMRLKGESGEIVLASACGHPEHQQSSDEEEFKGLRKFFKGKRSNVPSLPTEDSAKSD